jgi:ATP-dependent DNA ligase
VPSARSRSCFIDGEVIVVNERGLSVFDLIRSGRRDRDAVLCARDLRGAPIEERKHVLANLLFREGDGISFNDLYDGWT